MSLSSSDPLSANIRSLSLFGSLVDLQSLNPPAPAIQNYEGDQLYITGISVDGANQLVITIDDIGPPKQSVPALPNPAPTRAYATLSYNGSPAIMTTTAALTVNPNNAALDIGAIITTDTTLETLVTPWVNIRVIPDGKKEFLSYVRVSVTKLQQQLVWAQPPLVVPHTDPDSAHIIGPVAAGQIMGPWGIETP
jgi:hypothetical protein